MFRDYNNGCLFGKYKTCAVGWKPTFGHFQRRRTCARWTSSSGTIGECGRIHSKNSQQYWYYSKDYYKMLPVSQKNGRMWRGWWFESGGTIGRVERTRVWKHPSHVFGPLLSAPTPMYSYPNIPKIDALIRCYNPACTKRFKDNNARSSHIDRKPDCQRFYGEHLNALRNAAIP